MKCVDCELHDCAVGTHFCNYKGKSGRRRPRRVNEEDAYKDVPFRNDKADRKTENCSEKPNNWASTDEPQIFICPIQDDYEALIEDEPQTVSLTSAHISGDIYHKVKDEPQTERSE